jgi:hypothetical protein
MYTTTIKIQNTYTKIQVQIWPIQALAYHCSYGLGTYGNHPEEIYYSGVGVFSFKFSM